MASSFSYGRHCGALGAANSGAFNCLICLLLVRDKSCRNFRVAAVEYFFMVNFFRSIIQLAKTDIRLLSGRLGSYDQHVHGSVK